MKRLSILLAILAASCCGTQTGPAFYTNPVLHLDYSDPDVCRSGEDYWMTASSFNCFPGLPVLHSTDLVNWRLVGSALADYPVEEDFRNVVHHGKAVWAPSIRYHDGWYYIFVGDPDRGIFMVRSKDPAGAWEKPVWVVREKGFIDPCPLWDDDGNAFLSHAAAGSRAGLKSIIFVAPMSPDGTRLTGPSRIVFDGHFTQPTIEGTKFYKRNGYYYIFAPAGGVATGWQTVLRSRSPWGPYEDRIVMAEAEGTINGPHQGAWVQTPKGSDWFIHFQDKGAYGRIVHLQPMKWNADGWPLIGEDPDGDGVGQPVKTWESPHGTAQNPVQEPAAIGPYGLSLDWQYPAVPSPYWHYALDDGGIRLFSAFQADNYRSLWDCPNIIQQKFAAENFTVTAHLVFRPNPALDGEQAGFAVMGKDYAALRLTDTQEGALLQYVECKDASKGAEESATDITLLKYSGTPASVQLKVSLNVSARDTEGKVPDAVCTFTWDAGNGEKGEVPASGFIARPGIWTGAKWGFFCNRFTPKNDSGSLDIVSIRRGL